MKNWHREVTRISKFQFFLVNNWKKKRKKHSEKIILGRIWTMKIWMQSEKNDRLATSDRNPCENRLFVTLYQWKNKNFSIRKSSNCLLCCHDRNFNEIKISDVQHKIGPEKGSTDLIRSNFRVLVFLIYCLFQF